MMTRARGILSGLLLAIIFLIITWAWGCAGVEPLPDSDGAVTQGDGGEPPDLAPQACFMGNPETEAELLNRCTDAERIERPARIPESVWDGKGVLPEIP